METEVGGSWAVVGPAAQITLLISLAYLVARGLRYLGGEAIRRGWRPASLHRLALLGFAIAWAWAPATRAVGQTPAISEQSDSPKPPWSGSGGSPPPLPHVPTKGPSSRGDGPVVHPAIHARRQTSNTTSALFPRAGRKSVHGERLSRSGPAGNDPAEERSEPTSPLERHPEDPASCCSPRRYVVRSGDTLWDIAAEVLRTDNPRRIARYWPRIHRANRALIGSNPHLIRPGQVLELPEQADK